MHAFRQHASIGPSHIALYTVTARGAEDDSELTPEGHKMGATKSSLTDIQWPARGNAAGYKTAVLHTGLTLWKTAKREDWRNTEVNEEKGPLCLSLRYECLCLIYRGKL